MYKLYLSYNLFKFTGFFFTLRAVLKIHKHTTHLPQPLIPLSHCQYPISTPNITSTLPYYNIIWSFFILYWTRFKHEISDFLVWIISTWK